MKVIPPRAWRRKASPGGSEPKVAANSISEMLGAGRGLTAICEACLHSASLDLVDLARRLEEEHRCSEAALQGKLQCSVCKSREIVVRETESSDSSNRAPASRTKALTEV